MTFVSAPPANGLTASREPVKNLREREADRYHAVLATILATGLADALEAGDHAKAVGIINRGLAEGTPQLGCDLLRQAMATVGAARTWTVQIAPPRVPRPTAGS
jgi:hypothetical protein